MKQHTFIILFSLFFAFGTLSQAMAAEVQVTAQVDQQEIFQGQPFNLTITIENGDNVDQPEGLAFPNFRTQFRGQSQNSSIIITNGRRTSSKTLVLTYQLTPKTMTSTIPSVTLMVDGKPYATRPITIRVKQPEKNDNFKLEVRLSKPVAYVGEPLLMTTTWLISQKARAGEFNLPILSDPRFKTSSRTDLLPQDKNQLMQIELENETTLAKQYQTTLDGKDFLAITFFHTLIPQKTGDITLPEGTIAISALNGYRRDRFNRQREIYSTLVIPANSVSLKVLPLPTKNKPANFNGLVGQYTIEATASPSTVNVGDPITLRLTIQGETSQNITMPPLQLNDFKISTEPVKRQVKGDSVTFTTTIRARHEQITEIPAIGLSFFNVTTGKYETSHTKPIPIAVRATRIITAADALGGDTTIATKANEPVTEQPQGIHYNYSDIHEQQDPSDSRLVLWLALLLPPALFLLTMFLRRDIDSASKIRRVRKKRALKTLQKELKTVTDTALFTSWLNFLGDELDRPARAITAQDILPKLQSHPELAEQVKQIFQRGEASQYGGHNHALDPEIISQTATKLHKVFT